MRSQQQLSERVRESVCVCVVPADWEDDEEMLGPRASEANWGRERTTPGDGSISEVR
jgi:hypothetical protein